MRPLTSIIAAATLGTKPESPAFGDRSQKSLLIATAAACDLTPLISQKIWFSASSHRFATVAGELHPWAGFRLTPECQLAITSKPGMEIGDNSEVARLYQ